MSPLGPPDHILPTHVVLRITPLPFSSASMGLIQDDGTSFMSPYLMPLVSLPGTTPGPGLPYGQCAALLAAICNLGGTLYFPGGSAL